jgi:methyltransferase (TIGR00027 family)
MSQHGEPDIASGVGATAVGIAAARAVESTRPDRLMEDPFAAAFARAAPGAIQGSLRWPEDGAAVPAGEALLLQGANYIGLRSRFFDDYLVEAAATGAAQVVILAAGLDARAYRLDWPPGLRLFEIDQPGVLAFKDAVLRDEGARARCTRVAVPADLRAGWPVALRGAGFDPGLPTAWLAEGLLPYLTAATEQALFGDVDELSAAGSRLCAEYAPDPAALLDRGALRQVRGENSTVDMGRLIQAGPRPDPAVRLAGLGWTVTAEPATATAARYGRDLADPRLEKLPGTPLRLGQHTAFLTARKAA